MCIYSQMSKTNNAWLMVMNKVVTFIYLAEYQLLDLHTTTHPPWGDFWVVAPPEKTAAAATEEVHPSPCSGGAHPGRTSHRPRPHLRRVLPINVSKNTCGRKPPETVNGTPTGPVTLISWSFCRIDWCPPFQWCCLLPGSPRQASRIYTATTENPVRLG